VVMEAREREGAPGGGGLSGSLADWRKRLDEEDDQARRDDGGVSGGRREMSPNGDEVVGLGRTSQANLI